MKDSLSGTSTMASKVFASGERRDIGLKLGPWSAGLPGLSSGMILPTFHRGGTKAYLIDWVNRLAR